MLSIPQSYEDALWAAAARELGDEPLVPAVLRRAVVARSRRYTSERDRLDDELTGADALGDLAARALFFTPADAPKVTLPIAELKRAGALAGEAPVRVLDVGAGVGAMTLGLAASLGADRLRVVAVDRDAAAGRIFSDCAQKLGIELEQDVANVVGAELGSDRFDVAVAGSVLNELPESAALRLVADMIAAVGDRGFVIVVEPALRHTSRALHRIRDRTIQAGLASVFAPCTRSIAPCPMLEDERDWCHEDRHVELTARANQLTRTTGLRDSGLKFSYLVLSKQPPPQVEAGPGRRALRVVSQPRKTKGKLECFACGEAGRHSLRLLSRARSPSNKPFAKAKRGDVLILPDTITADLDSATDVDLVRVD